VYDKLERQLFGRNFPGPLNNVIILKPGESLFPANEIPEAIAFFIPRL
jgi:hypothetical protein